MENITEEIKEAPPVKGIGTRLTELETQIKDSERNKKKKKKFRLPFGKKPSKKKIKEGYCIVVVWGENNCVTIDKLPIVDNTVKVGETYHSLEANCIGLYKGKLPLIQVNKWNSQIYSPKKNFEDAVKDKSLTYGQQYIQARMLKDTIVQKKKMPGGIIIWIVILGIAGYFLFGGGI